MKTIYTVIIGDCDDLKEPLVANPSWHHVCITDQDFASDTWEVRKVPKGNRMTAKYWKLLSHNVTQDDSIYIDGTMYINCDLDQFWNQHFHSPISIPQHPYQDCVYAEGRKVWTVGKDTREAVSVQLEKFRELGIPYRGGMVASNIILRDRNSQKFNEVWFEEMLTGCQRDQIAWAYVNHVMPGQCRRFNYHYGEGREFLHVPHNYNPAKQKDRLRHYKRLQLLP